jgi:hypothetical protein
MDKTIIQRLLATPIITSVLLWLTVVSRDDGFPDIPEVIGLEMSRILTLKIIITEVPRYRNALGPHLINELTSDAWDRLISNKDLFDKVVTNIQEAQTVEDPEDRVDVLFISEIMREHLIEGDPTTYSILRRALDPLERETIDSCIDDCCEDLGISSTLVRRDVHRLYADIFTSLRP